MVRFNLHSIAVAVMADSLAQQTACSYPEGAFVGGLFHDIGQLLIATAMPEEFEEIARMRAERGKSLIESEKHMLGFTHEDLATDALAQWNLPVPIQTAVGAHHRILQPRRPGESYELAELLAAADESVKALGITIESVDPDYQPPSQIAAFEALGLSGKAPRILADFHGEFSAIKAAF